MKSIHFFQRFSQKENVVTNNTLLLLFRLYQHDYVRFQLVLVQLLDNVPDLLVGAQFIQQVKNKGSVPDGVIFQRSFKIVLETKLYDNYSQKQLLEHLNSFGDEDHKILLLLNPNLPAADFINMIKGEIRKYNVQTAKDIVFIPTTFEKIIEVVRDNLLEHDYEMKNLVDDFEEFCVEENLLPINDYLMKAVPCGFSLQYNLKYGVYYDPVDRAFRNYKYIGLYKNKSVRAVGKIEKVVATDFDFSTHTLTIKDPNHIFTTEEIKRVTDIILDTKKELSIDISKNHKFFIVDKFYETNYKKISKFPLQGGKLFDLRTIFAKDIPPIDKVAEKLKEETWE